jgi:hypothetical protein
MASKEKVGVTMRFVYAIGPVVLLVVAAQGRAADSEMTPSAVFQAASPSIVVVETFDAERQAVALGSGVVIAPGVVVTNCHVFKGASMAQVRYQHHRLEATLRDSDLERDLCSLTVDALTAPPARLGSASQAQVGDRVYAIGAPQGLELTLSDGLISSLRPLGGRSILLVTAPISHGSSGGGLFDNQARLIGITTMYLSDSQQLNFAVPVEWVNELPKHANDDARAAVDAATAAQASADEAAASADAEKSRLEPSKHSQFQVRQLTIGASANQWNEIDEPRDIFLPDETMHASVLSDGDVSGVITARWTYGDDKQIVDVQTKTVPIGPQITEFSISKPDGWPIGVYQLNIFVNAESIKHAFICVQDGGTLCRQVQGIVYSYTQGNVRHYASEPPPSGVKDVRTIKYFFYELIDPSKQR